VSGTDENVTYYLDTVNSVTSLYRNDQSNDTPIATNIDAIRLFYRDEHSVIITAGNEDDIRHLQITLVAKTSEYDLPVSPPPAAGDVSDDNRRLSRENLLPARIKLHTILFR